MSVPKLVHPSSGLGGRGYRNPFTGEIVPGITSVDDVFAKPQIVAWHVKQTAAFAIANVDYLTSRDEDAGMRYLEFFSRRLTPEKMDKVEIYDYSMGVLNDYAETGTFMHDYTEARRNDWFEPEPHPERWDLWEMIEAFEVWASEHSWVTTATEATLFGRTSCGPYAGTADAFGILDGVPTLLDDKTSRKVYESHEAQLAALGAADMWAKEVPEGTPGAVYYEILPSVAKHHGGQVDSWWVEEEVPTFSQYGVLQMRPTDGFEAPFAKFHPIHASLIDAGWDRFQAGLAARHAGKKRKDALKALGKEDT